MSKILKVICWKIAGALQKLDSVNYTVTWY